uniref:Uncharacterized protein n=1 Tax=Alexandrium monilatum TaxID=311494 RepID=A0A7S4WC21_9DINO
MFSARGSLRAGRGRGARALPVLLPCLVFTVAGLALFSALISLRLPQPSEDFVGGRGAAPQRMLVQREYKPRITDRGTPEYEKYMEEQRALREQMWNAQNRDINAKVGGIDSESAPPPPPRAAPAPAPAPASAPKLQSVPAPAAPSGGNPFQFIFDLFTTTTTTTTTTPPPSPIDSFLSAIGFR